MEFREFLIFLHIGASLVWVGGAVTLEVVGHRTLKRRNAEAIAGFATDAEMIGRLYAVSSALVLGMGIWLVADANFIDFSETWVLISLILTSILFLMGPFFFGRQAGLLIKESEAKGGDHPDVIGRAQRVLLVGRLDTVIAFFIVWLMVVKPGG